MYRITVVMFFLFALLACKPFSKNETENQFVLQKNKLFFMGHELVAWQSKKIPHCKQCSFNLYTKKMLPGAMLFKQINNERGDLVLLVASNIRYSFGVQTGGLSYSIATKRQGEKVTLTVDSQAPLSLALNQQQIILLGGLQYGVSLQGINVKKDSVALVFWRVNVL